MNYIAAVGFSFDGSSERRQNLRPNPASRQPFRVTCPARSVSARGLLILIDAAPATFNSSLSAQGELGLQYFWFRRRIREWSAVILTMTFHRSSVQPIVFGSSALSVLSWRSVFPTVESQEEDLKDGTVHSSGLSWTTKWRIATGMPDNPPRRHACSSPRNSSA